MASTQCEEQWLCKPCNLLFRSWESLLAHKGKVRLEKKDDNNHIHCKFCGQDFKTESAEYRHIQQKHPKEQDLHCPGCGQGPFPRLGALVAHIEYGKCIRLDTGVIEEIREKKLEFPRKLAALTQKPVKNNYENFMPSAGSVDPELGWTTTEDAALFKLSDGDFPALSSETKGTILKTSTLVQKEEGITSGGLTARAIFDAMDPHDPEHPLFNVGRYCCEFTGKFNCPKDRCCKTFKSSNGLISHLKSHTSKTYRCPGCMKIFRSITAIAQHTESSAAKCRMRDTSGYESYLDQLTAGIVDVEEERNEDGTLKFKTSEETQKLFQNLNLDGNIMSAVGVALPEHQSPRW